MFGKSFAEYVRFQRWMLVLIAAVGVLRLVLSLAGAPNEIVRFFSMTVAALVGLVYYAVAVHTSGFGSYKQILPLLLIQNVLANTIAIAGILLSLAGLPNIFTAPEYGGQISQAFHIGGHVVFGILLASLIGWGLASLIMLVTKKVSGPRPAAA
jgi:hypothetical protein